MNASLPTPWTQLPTAPHTTSSLAFLFLPRIRSTSSTDPAPVSKIFATICNTAAITGNVAPSFPTEPDRLPACPSMNARLSAQYADALINLTADLSWGKRVKAAATNWDAMAMQIRRSRRSRLSRVKGWTETSTLIREATGRLSPVWKQREQMFATQSWRNWVADMARLISLTWSLTMMELLEVVAVLMIWRLTGGGLTM
ncbi:hypothetical protein BDZ85DRAFT_98679 [Elsinoe ampelina]|uniref:Uncharacterized protein n=1 Tax=Elsinoe ampelina TaxID=302913 RepID=A0A6A6GEL8_9PEZI|nr:hypothetical protein BDZ85DRAFT_98679 [Elsinoe ampelina]